MFGKRTEKKIRVLFKCEVAADGTWFEAGEIDEISAASAKRLIGDGVAEATTQEICHFDRRHEGGDWRRNERRDWGERRALMQLPSE